MKIENIIRMIDNKEYISIEKGENHMECWYILETEDERIDLVFDKANDLYGIYVFGMNGVKIKNFWERGYGEIGYNIFNCLYNDVERDYEQLKEENMKDIKLTQGDLELVLVALSKMDEDREKYVEVYNAIISQLRGEDIID